MSTDVDVAELTAETSPVDAASGPQSHVESITWSAVTQGARAVRRGAASTWSAVTQGARAVRRGAASAASAARKGTLADARPKSLRQSRDWHHRCASHYEALLVKWPRLWWGYAHLTFVKPALNFAEWVTECPPRSAVALAVLAAIWFGS